MPTYRTTTRNQIRTPSGAIGDPPDGPGGMATFADDVEAFLGIGGAEYAANLAAITAIPAGRCFDGKRAYAADTKFLYRYDGTVPGWRLWDTGGQWSGLYAAPGGAVTYPTGIIFNFGSPLSGKFAAGQIFLRGNMKKASAGNFATGDALGTLNSAWWPKNSAYHLGNGVGSAFCSFLITNAGVFTIDNVKGTTPSWVSLDGMNFDPYN